MVSCASKEGALAAGPLSSLGRATRAKLRWYGFLKLTKEEDAVDMSVVIGSGLRDEEEEPEREAAQRAEGWWKEPHRAFQYAMDTIGIEGSGRGLRCEICHHDWRRCAVFAGWVLLFSSAIVLGASILEESLPQPRLHRFKPSHHTRPSSYVRQSGLLPSPSPPQREEPRLAATRTIPSPPPHEEQDLAATWTAPSPPQRDEPRLAAARTTPVPKTASGNPSTSTMCLHQVRMGGVDVYEANTVGRDERLFGTWGGTCTCPNGLGYLVADREDACASLACEGGVSGDCRREEGLWNHQHVVCGQALPSRIWNLKVFGRDAQATDKLDRLIYSGTLVGTPPDLEDVCFNSETASIWKQFILRDQSICYVVEAEDDSSLRAEKCVEGGSPTHLDSASAKVILDVKGKLVLSFSLAAIEPPSPDPLRMAPPSPLPLAPDAPASPRPSPPKLDQLSVETCEAAFNTPSHLFRRMWDRQARTQSRPGEPACWDYRRDCGVQACPLKAEKFWEETRTGYHCSDNWYEGSGDAHGDFRAAAPALLGFDDDIHRVCVGSCDNAGFNILELFSQQVPYNTCRNLEWQVCAAQGKLREQFEDHIKFAVAPKDLNLYGDPAFGCCSGWTNRQCDIDTGFANDDIFYLEVCIFSQICSNRNSLFNVEAMEAWRCDFDMAGFDALMKLLRGGPQPGEMGGSCDVMPTNSENCANKVFDQCGGKAWKGQRCCTADAQCVGGTWYKQCRPMDDIAG